MSLLDRLLPEQRATSGVSKPAGWFLDLFGGGDDTYSGKRVNPESALGLVPVYSAVQTIAGDTGSLPLIVYRRLQPRGRERARDHRTWSMLHEQPNDLMAADVYWETVMAHNLLWGEHFSAKERGPDGLVSKLWPLSPERVTMEVSKDRRGVRYLVDGVGPGGRGTYYGPDSILHIRGLSLDGIRGISPVSMAKHMIGNGLALEEFQGRFWTNNARPSGILKHPEELSDKAAKRLERRWQNAHGGLANAARVAILEEGMEWQSLGMPLKDAEFVQQANLTRTDVALIFRLPPYKLAADNGSSMRYENTETAAIDYVKFCLRYWLRRIESSLVADPDIFLQGTRFYAEFLVDALLRGDSAQRAAYYTAALDPAKGWMSRDEVRDRENLNPDHHENAPPAPAPPKDPNAA